MPEITQQLKGKYRNVGVLRFRVQEGTAKESFTAPMCGRMIDRIETLLMVHNGSVEANALGVIHDAAKTASKARINQWYSSTADRRKLFDQSYSLAWGNKMVKADAFITGKVTVGKDGKTTLALECFDRANPATFQRLGTFTIDTDRFVWRDLGYSFAMTKRGRTSLTGKRSSVAEQDKHLFIFRPKRRQQPNDVTKAEPGNIGGVSLKVLADEQELEIREAATEGDGAKWEMKSPAQGKKIVFRLENSTEKKRGIVVRLNGKNVIAGQADDPETSAKFVLLGNGEKKNTKLDIKGFLKLAEGNGANGGKGKAEVQSFKVLVGKEAEEAKAQFGEKAGLLEVIVFEEGETETNGMLIAPRGLPLWQEKRARASYSALRRALMRSSKLTTKIETVRRDGRVVKRELIVPDEAAMEASGPIEFVSFKGKSIAELRIKVLPGDGAGSNPPN